MLWNERTTVLSLALAFEKFFTLPLGRGAHGADLRHLLTSAKHSAVAHHHRMSVLTERSRWFCAFLSFVTIALIPVDAVLLPFAAWTTLAVGRLAASAAEAALSVWHPKSECIERHAYIFLGAIMSIVMLWEVFSCAALKWLGADSVPASAFVTYFYEPFVVALGLAIFPLTIAEALLLLVPVLLGMAVNTLNWPVELGPISPPAILLRLLVIGMVGAAASAIQLENFLTETERSARDKLTGLLNRKFGGELIAARLRTAQRKKTPCSILFLDLDGFKIVNDRFGHEAGDRLLIDAAQALSASFRPQDIVVRWGGEEFLILIADTDESGALSVIRRLAERGLGKAPNGQPMTASIGVVQADGPGKMPFDALIARADARMYQAKRAGRNRFVSNAGIFPFVREAAGNLRLAAAPSAR